MPLAWLVAGLETDAHELKPAHSLSRRANGGAAIRKVLAGRATRFRPTHFRLVAKKFKFGGQVMHIFRDMATDDDLQDVG